MLDDIAKKIVTDESKNPIAVQIAYSDWLRIERLLDAKPPEPRVVDLRPYHGVLSLTVDPLNHQRTIRAEWDR